MSQEPGTYSLREDAAQFFARFVADHAGAPKTLTDLVKVVFRLGDLTDAQLAQHRTALRRLRKLIDTAVAIGEGYADDKRKATQAKREAEAAE